MQPADATARNRDGDLIARAGWDGFGSGGRTLRSFGLGFDRGDTQQYCFVHDGLGTLVESAPGRHEVFDGSWPDFPLSTIGCFAEVEFNTGGVASPWCWVPDGNGALSESRLASWYRNRDGQFMDDS